MRWKCRDGTVLEISEMTDRHLANAIAYMRRNASVFQERSLRRLNASVDDLQGECAQDHANDELRAFEEMDAEEFIETHPSFLTLLAEQRRRARQARNEEIANAPTRANR